MVPTVPCLLFFEKKKQWIRNEHNRMTTVYITVFNNGNADNYWTENKKTAHTKMCVHASVIPPLCH